MFRSKRSIVIAPAKTGKERTNKKPATIILQTKRGIFSNVISPPRAFHIVHMKFKLLKIDLTPAKCRLKIAKSTAAPLWPKSLLRGGYTVHPVPTPLSHSLLVKTRIIAGGKSQKLKLFKRGNLISWVPNIRGNIQFPKPPIDTGITKKKIIKIAWAVTMTL
jgi:hypothetical protein